VTELGFKGALINGHTQGRFLDDRLSSGQRHLHLPVAALPAARPRRGPGDVLGRSPLHSNEEGRGFLAGAPICANDKERIAHGNVERLLHVELLNGRVDVNVRGVSSPVFVGAVVLWDVVLGSVAEGAEEFGDAMTALAVWLVGG
jgi:hypothetical protein